MKHWGTLPTLVTLIFAVVVLGATGCSIPQENGQIDWVPFVRFAGITYTIHERTTMPSDELGPVYATVKFKLEGHVHTTGYPSKDGDAAYLDPGTPLYLVKGYTAAFRLATKDLRYYDAHINPAAKTGKDLLDIAGKVLAIGIAPSSGIEQWHIQDEPHSATLTMLVMDAPVQQGGILANPEPLYFVIFHLRDGTRATRAFYPNAKILDNGIMVPQQFVDAILATAQ